MKQFKKVRRYYRLAFITLLAAIVLSISWVAISAVAKLFAPGPATAPPPEAIAVSTATPSASPSPETAIVKAPESDRQPKLGHFPYSESQDLDMVYIGSYAEKENQRFEKLSLEAALALMKLIYAARDDNTWIVPVSGFRSIEQQEKLYKDQIQRRGSETEAAKISAPPGYSEHHTGYAVDLTDGNSHLTDLTYKFAESDAFRWLSQHAREYGFELSFPQNNFQGVSYEPWHWRFVGSPKAEEIFKQARAESHQLDRKSNGKDVL
ncbi:M15 family metallopeptidase [Pseudanabaena sp. PCC 6802]|uniref:M15 family metallopeptidase n=1 Tax=Pseudanabaena sp. PCC 6802 TaxID=118173 RepID=UPI000344E66E|nr:M15 family metallopeptidase [Pseudanabaena sp. PCC 6802]